jgi:hypothetical protein
MAIAAMLTKKEGATLVAKLHITILLFMADYNYMNKHIGWVMMSNAESYGQLAIEQ